MWLDALIVLMVLALAFGGFLRGGPEAAIRLAGLPLAYGAAILASLHAGGPAAAALGAPEWVGTVVSGALGFILVHAGVGITALKVRERTEWISQPSRFAGVCLGAARGLVFALPLLWLANFAEGARSSGLRPDLPDLSGAILPVATKPAFQAGSAALVDESDPSSRMTARIVAEPGVALGAAQGIVSDHRIQMLQSDPGFWADIERGAVSSAMRRPTFRDLARDAGFRRKLGDLGLISADAVRDPQLFELEMAQVFGEVGPRIASVRNDPEFKKMMADPELRRRIQEGEGIALLGHPGLRAMIARASEDPK
jgi:uncharacterized membrane protein required for colicin V production